jgi:hypothetical protein
MSVHPNHDAYLDEFLAPALPDILAVGSDGRAHPAAAYLVVADRYALGLGNFLHLVNLGRLVRVAGEGGWWYALPESPAHRALRLACAMRHAPSIARDDKPRALTLPATVKAKPAPGPSRNDQVMLAAIARSPTPLVADDIARIGDLTYQGALAWIRRNSARLTIERHRTPGAFGGKPRMHITARKATA